MSAKILIVEDEILIGMELENALEERGYQVLGIAADYKSAMTLAVRNPDVALIDINLRDGPTGPLIAREIASRTGASILFVTANPKEVGVPIATAVGVVTKPAENDIVTAAVDYAVAVRAGQRKETPEGLAPLELVQRRASGEGTGNLAG